MPAGETFLVLGGGGMIGRQIVRAIAAEVKPHWIIVCSLYQKEVREAIEHLRREFPYVQFIPFWGDVFLREEWNTTERQHHVGRAQLLESAGWREALYEDLFGSIDEAYARSQLVRLIAEHRPDVVIDSINTATAISYQDVYAASERLKRDFTRLEERATATVEGTQEADLNASPAVGRPTEADALAAGILATGPALDKLLISQPVPQLIRHVLLMHRAMSDAGTRLYLKVGTTGTGGMGLNIPYTHSEDRPSVTLMTKTAIAFAHTGLMFLMARTPDGPVVKEIKPGAMVGYANITRQTMRRGGKPMFVFESKEEPLGGRLDLRQPEREYAKLHKLQMVVVDTGENGLFTRNEFEAITHLGQMEFVTPEEIAHQVVLEVKGSNTGHDIIAAVDSAVMDPSYRAGFLRHLVLEQIGRLREATGTHSVALGQLGPPELGKLLWEAHLLRLRYACISTVLEESDEMMAVALLTLVQEDTGLRDTITSVGLPILTPDGASLIRGPAIRIPEAPNAPLQEVTPERVDRWAAKGWVDLRPQNMARWRERFLTMHRHAHALHERGSAAMTRWAYPSDEILPGSLVGWILNNEIQGYRIK